MKTEDEIYVPLVDMGVEDGGIQPSPIWWKRDKSTEKQDCKGVVKYIRADLAELTWEDIPKIISLVEQLHDEHGPIRVLKLQEFYQEVLRRFLESKKEK